MQIQHIVYRLSRIVLPAAVALSLAACGTSPSPSSSTPEIQATGMMELVNQTRRSHGLPTLRRSAKLDAAARNHGRDMAAKNYFAHTSPSGVTMSQRIAAVGYGACYAAENIGWGSLYADPRRMMQAWMGSSGHRKNLLHPKMTEVGFAKVNDANGSHDSLWVMNFGRPGC